MIGALEIWTIYARPTDYPHGYEARKFMIGGGEARPTDVTHRGHTLDQVRAKLPHGLVRIYRSPEDDPVIVETWL